MKKSKKAEQYWEYRPAQRDSKCKILKSNIITNI